MIKPTAVLLICLIAPTLVAYNAWRFLDAEAKPSSKERLLFLPEPHVARALSLGHTNTQAKLRWIDSYTYFSHQIDTKDDSVAGDGRGTFHRLYDLLTTLDPTFGQFYLHAVLTTSGIVSDNHIALRFLCLGVLNLPQSPAMWGNLAGHLKTFYHYEEKHPEQMEGLLKEWAASVHPSQVALPYKWLSLLGTRQQRGDAQVDYWLALLHQTTIGSNEERLIDTLLRQQIALWHCRLLEQVAELPADQALTGLSLAQRDLPERAQSPYGPLGPDGRIRRDPFGGSYFLSPDGTVLSQGLIAYTLQHQLRKDGSLAPERLAHYPALGLQRDGDQVTFPDPGEPWPLR